MGHLRRSMRPTIFFILLIMDPPQLATGGAGTSALAAATLGKHAGRAVTSPLCIAF